MVLVLAQIPVSLATNPLLLASLATNPSRPPFPFPPPSSPPSSPPTPPPVGWDDDLYALSTLYAQTNGTQWRNRNNWGHVHPCVYPWQGVQCDASGADDGRVQVVRLPERRLNGALPTQLGLLQFARELSFYGNELTGTVPTQLAGLTRLEALDLTDNDLSGTLPAFASAQLRVLRVTNSARLSGTLPFDITGAGAGAPAPAQLRALQATATALSGTLPSRLGAPDAQLESLHAARTRLSGSLPSELGRATRLQHLMLDWASLSGTVPAHLGDATDLALLSLEHNRLSGSVPIELGGRCARASDVALDAAPPPPAAPPGDAFAIEGPCTHYYSSGSVRHCVRSANFPSDYRVDEACTVTPLWLPMDVSATAFATEAGYDIMTVEGVEYSGTAGPDTVRLTQRFHWRSDGSSNDAGWEVCATAPAPSTVGAYSSADDGPRAFQHPDVAARLRTTFATLRFRGNPAMTTNDLAATLPTDIRDLTSHDLCALAAGPVSVEVGRSGTQTTLGGGLLEAPSLRSHDQPQ